MASSHGLRSWWDSRDLWAPKLENLRDLVNRPSATENLKQIAKQAPSTAVIRERVRRPQVLDNVGGVVKRVFEKKEASRYAAYDRLKAVMLQDRTTMSAEELIALRNQLLVIMTNYVAIDRNWMRWISSSRAGLCCSLPACECLLPRIYTGEGEEVESAQWLLPPQKTAALKRKLLDTVGSYLPIFPDSAEVIEVIEEHRSDSMILFSSVRIAGGVDFEREEAEEEDRTTSQAAEQA